jgi:hypothetical protein
LSLDTETATATRILEHIGEPTTAPAPSPARGPLAWEQTFDQTLAFDPVLVAAPKPALEFDQTVTG